MFPMVIRAAAGPHDLGPGGHDDEGLPEAEVRLDLSSDSDIVSGLWGEDKDDDMSFVASVDSEPDTVIHNTAPVRSLQCLPPPILITMHRTKGMVSIRSRIMSSGQVCNAIIGNIEVPLIFPR